MEEMDSLRVKLRDETLETERFRDEASHVTRLLCSVMRQLENNGYAMDIILDKVEGLDKWWVKHQEWDIRRVRQEIESKLKDMSYEQLKAINGQL